MKSAAVEFEGVSKTFPAGLEGKNVRALDGLNLRIETNEVYGLLGPNGAGKSTALKIMLGLVRPDAGICRVLGRNAQRIEARISVGYLPESPWFPRHLSGSELVNFYGRLCGMPARDARTQVQRVLELVGLADAGNRRVGTYSKGMLQRLGLAQALVHDPCLVILDEPTAGVDPRGVDDISRIILRLKAAGKTVLLCSHLLSQIEEVCGRVGILHQGRILLEGSMPGLVEAAAGHGSFSMEAGAAQSHARLASPPVSLHRVYLERIQREEVAGAKR